MSKRIQYGNVSIKYLKAGAIIEVDDTLMNQKLMMLHEEMEDLYKLLKIKYERPQQRIQK